MERGFIVCTVPEKLEGWASQRTIAPEIPFLLYVCTYASMPDMQWYFPYLELPAIETPSQGPPLGMRCTQIIMHSTPNPYRQTRSAWLACCSGFHISRPLRPVIRPVLEGAAGELEDGEGLAPLSGPLRVCLGQAWQSGSLASRGFFFELNEYRRICTRVLKHPWE